MDTTIIPTHLSFSFFFNDTATTEIYTLSLHDALPIFGRPVEHLAVVPVFYAQHFRPVGVVAAALAPQVGRLDGRHQDFLGTRAVLLLAHDALDVLQHAEAQGQPGIDAGRGLADQAGAQHQTVRDDLRLCRVFLHGRQKVLTHPHSGSILAGLA